MTIITLVVCDFTYSLHYRSCTHDLLDRSTERKAMKKQLVLIIPILAAMIGMFAIVGLSSVNAQNMSTPDVNMNGGNTTIGNMTGGNAGNMTTPTNMTTP